MKMKKECYKADKRMLIAAAVIIVVLGVVMIMLNKPTTGSVVPECKTSADCTGACAIECAGAHMVCEAGQCKCICSPVPEPGTSATKADDTGATPAGIMTVVDANNQFAFEMYSKLNSDPQNAGKNIFFSPYSISTALAMTYEGANGQTADEMAEVFHFPVDDTTRRSAYARIYNSLNAPGPNELSTANALWAQKDFRFLEEYLGTVEKYYLGKVTNLDFVAKTEESRITINTWVENQTRNRIKDLIPQGAITAMTRLVLTNAIYFKGKWAMQFNSTFTRDSDFTVSLGNTVNAQMMSMSGKRFNYTEDDKMQVLEMPYEGNDLSMLVLLPKGNDISAVESSLNNEKLDQIKAGLHEVKLPVSFPKFKFETMSMLADTLIAMGMPTAFSGAADFSGMDGAKDLHISEVIHKAFVEVNEEGTEAAAATAVIMELTAVMPTVEFTADHPFIFLIQEKSTGEILFLGKVTDPTQAN